MPEIIQFWNSPIKYTIPRRAVDDFITSTGREVIIWNYCVKTTLKGSKKAFLCGWLIDTIIDQNTETIVFPLSLAIGNIL